jgi:hypothetical protein
MNYLGKPWISKAVGNISLSGNFGGLFDGNHPTIPTKNLTTKTQIL